MNVCIVCQGDGVLIAGGQWYCINHLDEAFVRTAMIVARLKGHDEDRVWKLAEKWYEEL